MYSFLNPMSIKWAVELGIPNVIHNHGQPITLSDLVSALEVPQAKATCVQRLMRLLAHNGFFAIIKVYESKEEAYALTPTSQLLVSGTDHCLSAMVGFLNDPTLVGVYHQLGKWTCGEDRTIIETALGPRGYWDFVHQTPTHMQAFNEAMESDSHVMRLALRDCKSVFEGLDSIVDVGGGTGNTAKIICEAFPNLKYIVLDLPQVVDGLTGNKNLSFVSGNMLKSIPQADAILLKWVLHNWGDDDCIKILKNCKDAISGRGKGGKVIIIDIVINEKQDEHEMTEVKLLCDVIMMTSLNGKERDEKDWKRLFMDAGFKYYKIFPTFGFRSLIELYP
uniref:isoflavone 7-O-methyltransferase n=2 Tax=Cajanus cajan TaxID=3821 RepID=A0A151RHM2_CAJCA|nr:Isoflavone-7-O-methyltransferase 9 [Cajanus cajan]